MGQRRVKLGLTDMFSDKIYIMNIVEQGDDLYQVVAKYGKRYRANNIAIKPDKPVSFGEANQIFDKLMASKLKKGYRIEEQWD